MTTLDGEWGDFFGVSVAIHGTTVIVGAQGDQDNGNQSGSAYLFDTITGTQIAKRLAPDGAAADYFGAYVALDAATAVVGAFGDSDNGYFTGSAYVFSSTTGAFGGKVVAPDGELGDTFAPVAISGSTLLVGSTGDDDSGANAGAAYTFDLANQPDNTGNAFCFGDGTGAACPCNANGLTGAGCANSGGAGGALLSATGHASVAFDSFQMQVLGVPAASIGLLLRTANATNGGLGFALGDGLLCGAGQSLRSQLVTPVGGVVTLTQFQGASFGQTSLDTGVDTNYQFWYRDSLSTCSGSMFNFSNAWRVKWLP